MGLIGNQHKNKPEEKIDTSKDAPEKKPGRDKIVPVVIILLVLALLASLVGGGYWAFIHQDELIERFFQPRSAEEVQGENVSEEKKSYFFRKLIKRDRTITVRGTLLGEEGGAAVLINKKVIPAGTVINGIRILEITNESIVVELNGLKRRLQVGETFDPDKE